MERPQGESEGGADRFAEALQAAKLGSWEWEIKTGKVFWSETLEAIYGLPPGGFDGSLTQYQSLIHPDDRELVRETVRRSVDERDNHRLTHRIVHPSGEVRWVDAFGTLVLDAEGKPERLIGISRDVTAWQEAEVARRLSERQLGLIVNGVQDHAISMLDAEGHIVTWNAAAEQIKGYRLDEVRGQHFRLMFTEADRLAGLPEEELETARREGVWRGEGWRLRKDGGCFYAAVSISPIFDAQQHLQGFVKVTHDVTERVMMARTWRFLVDTTAHLSESLDSEAVLTEVARLAVGALADLCSIDLFRADKSVQLVALKHRDPDVELALREMRQSATQDPFGELVRAVMNTARTQVLPQGEEVPEGVSQEVDCPALQRALRSQLVVVPLVSRSLVIGALTIGRSEHAVPFCVADLAAFEELARRVSIAIENARLFRDLEGAREEAVQANRAKDEFLAVLGHELRNPLSPILTAVKIMELRGDQTFTRERDAIKRQVKHMAHLIDDLLDVSRITRGRIELHKEFVAVSDVVAQAVEMAGSLIEQRAHELLVDVAPGLVVYGDRSRLAQVMSNLLNNAAKYTDKRGVISVRAWKEAEAIVLQVRDNGKGIAPTLLPRVFDFFTQETQSLDRSSGGLGLGLSIVKSMTELHGGLVRAESEGVGKGSTFTVTLPSTAEGVKHAPPSAKPLSARPASQQRPKLLVVDDVVDTAVLLREGLTLLGYDVKIAHDGPAALVLVHDWKPDLAVLDIGLPVMDGNELAGRLRALPGFETIPLIALTAYAQLEDRRRTRDAGFQEHLVKPVNFERLQSAIERLIAQPVGAKVL